MNILVIGKPTLDYIVSLEEFPKETDKFIIDNSIKTMNNFTEIISILLSMYGCIVNYTGVIGEDEVGNKIRKILESYNINTKYIETSYEESTCVNYKIYNRKNNTFTNIFQNSIKNNLIKYKYDFEPNVVIMDDGDYNANMAAINNYPNSKLIYIGTKYTTGSNVYLNKCKYVIANTNFITNATGVYKNLDKPKVVVSMFQKFIDMYNTNIIVKLDNFDILYVVDDEVRIIKNINKNLKNKDNVYLSVLCYFLVITDNIELSIKYTNKVMLESNNDIDMINNIPSKNNIDNILNSNNVKNDNIEVFDNTNMSDKEENNNEL